MKKKLVSYLLILACLFFLIKIFNCSKDSKTPVRSNPPPVVQKASLKIFLASLPNDFEQVNLKIKKVSLHLSEVDSCYEGWMTILDSLVTYDLAKLTDGNKALLVEKEIEIGKLNEIRLILADSSTVVKEGIESPLFVPSGLETGIKVTPPKELISGKTVEITIVFDLANSIKYVDSKYMLKPVAKIVE